MLKTLEFLNSRRPDLEIRAAFIHQLTAYENRLVSQGMGPKTSKWTEVHDKTNEFENEELLLRNTYLNAQMGPFADFSAGTGPNKPAKLKWADSVSREKKQLATVIGDEFDNPFPQAAANPIIKKQAEQIESNKIESKPLKSIPTKKTDSNQKVREPTPQRQKPESKKLQPKEKTEHQGQNKPDNKTKFTKVIPNETQIKPKYNNFIDSGKQCPPILK